jgi:hypothetical protein
MRSHDEFGEGVTKDKEGHTTRHGSRSIHNDYLPVDRRLFNLQELCRPWTGQQTRMMHLTSLLVRHFAQTEAQLTLCTVRAEEDKQVLGEEETYEEFHPSFTYPVRLYCMPVPHLPLIYVMLSRFTEKTKRFMATRTW